MYMYLKNVYKQNCNQTLSYKHMCMKPKAFQNDNLYSTTRGLHESMYILFLYDIAHM